MRSLLRFVSLRHLAHEPIKVSLSLLGVAIGVAVFVSIRLSNQTALSSFTSTLDAVAGKANFQIVANDEVGFSESVFKTLRSLKSGAVFTPVIESVPVIVSTNRPLIVLGIDIFSDAKFRTYTPQEVPQNQSEGFLGELFKPNSIIISSSIAKDYGLRIGDTLGLRSRGTPVRLVVRSILKLDGPAQAMGGNFALMDIASAQEAFGKSGKLDRIDVLLPEDERRDELLEGIRQALPANVTITRPQNRTEQTVKMLAAFNLNLTALAFIATFVAMFLIYNTILTSALRRRKEIGTVRSVGAAGFHIFLMFIIEALIIGVTGSLLGVGLGILLAEGARAQVLQTVSALWLQVAANSTHVTPSILLQGFALGVMTTFLAAAFPAYEAMRTPIRETFSTATLEERFSINFKKLFAVCLAILIAAGASSVAPAVGRIPLFGFLSAILLLIGAAFLTPALVLLLGRIIRPVIGKLSGIEGSLAAEYLVQSLRRSSIAIAALMVAFAMLIGVDTMISSFRTTVEVWIGQTMKSDIYVGLRANMNSAGNQAPLADEVVRYIRALPEARSVDTFRGLKIRYNGEQTTLASVDIVAANAASRMLIRRGNNDAVIRDVRNGRGVLVTESFALRHQLAENDSVSLITPKGIRSFRLLGVFYDYSTDGGMIIMDKSSFTPLWNDSSVSNIAVELHNDSMLPVVKERIERDLAAPYGIIAFSNNDLRRQVFTIFDQTFAITYALEAIAIIVAVIGIINALLMMIVEREREIGILKAVGASNWQVQKMVIVNGGLIGACAAVIGSVTGLLLSLILVFVINRQSFGWSIQYHPNIVTIASVSAVLIVTAMLSALWPAFVASRKIVKNSLRYE